jgi:hypothetical protein
VIALDEGHVERTQRERRSGRRDDEPVVGKSTATADLGRRRAADQRGAGAVGDHRRVHRVVEMGVYGQHGVEPVDAQAGQATVDAR